MGPVPLVGAHDSVPLPYPDLPNRSPWIAQLAPDGPPRPLEADTSTDVAIVGAGIAGVATAFFTLRDTDRRVLLIERDRVARGATGRNAGQLTTYFERPLYDIADEFGADMAIDGQRAFDDAHDLLDLMAAESGATVRIDRFTGHMGMFSLNHLQVHLRNNLLRRQGGLREEACVVSEDAEFLDQIPAEFASYYTVVQQSRIRELLETDDDRYRAVLSDRKGCVNSGQLVQQVLAYLERRVPGPTSLRRSDPRRPDRRRRRPGRRPRQRTRGGGVAGRDVHQRVRRPRHRGRDRRPDPTPRGPAGDRHDRLHGGLCRGAAARRGGDELHPEHDDRR